MAVRRSLMSGASAPRRRQTRPSRAGRPAFKGTLIATGLTKSYKGRRVVNGVSLGVRAGEAVGLLGRTAPARRPASTW